MDLKVNEFIPRIYMPRTHIFQIVLVVFFNLHCGSGASMGGGSGKVSSSPAQAKPCQDKSCKAQSTNPPPGGGVPVPAPVPPDTPTGDDPDLPAPSPGVNPGPGPGPGPGPSPETALETFAFTSGYVKTKVDYVLVLDNSSSMSNIIGSIRDRMVEVAQAGGFPDDSRVAVMSTMIGQAPSYADVHSEVSKYPGIQLEPGFLDFVHNDAINRYKAAVTQTRANKWSIPGCSGKWFTPKEMVPGTGYHCIEAAMQTSQQNVGVEAGTHAFGQLLTKNAATPLFRAGSVVNVVFISDTHDPGKNIASLINTLPSFSALRDATFQNSRGILGVKFHTASPENGGCGDYRPQAGLRSYLNLTLVSSGSTLDVCDKSADYLGWVYRMIDSSYLKEPKFTLAKPAHHIVKVLVNNVPYTNFSLSADKTVLEIRGLNGTSQYSIKVTYVPL